MPRGLAMLLVASLATTAEAAAVRGTVTLAPEARRAADESRWRVDNGVLPVAPVAADAREAVVALLPSADGKKAAPAEVAVELHGLRLDPLVVVVPAGGTVQFKNGDRVPHTLYVVNGATLMPPAPTPAGQTRAQKFPNAGEYELRDEEYPHVRGTVLVLDTPYVVRPDDKGVFKLDAPEGRYTLRVFYRGRVVTQPLEVGAHGGEVTVQVPATTGVAAATANGRAASGAGAKR